MAGGLDFGGFLVCFVYVLAWGFYVLYPQKAVSTRCTAFSAPPVPSPPSAAVSAPWSVGAKPGAAACCLWSCKE